MRPSSLGGAAYCVALCLSVCPSVRLSVCLSVRPVMVTERHVAPPSECTFRQAPRAAYRTAISAAQILVFFHRLQLVSLFVNRITQKLLHRFSRNLVKRWTMANGRNVYLLVVVLITLLVRVTVTFRWSPNTNTNTNKYTPSVWEGVYV